MGAIVNIKIQRKNGIVVYNLRIPIRGFCLELDDTLRAPVPDVDRADKDDDEGFCELDGVAAGDAVADVEVDADVDGARALGGHRAGLAGLIV